MYGQGPSWATGSVSNLQLAPDRGFEPRTLRLTDRCTRFRNGVPNSLSAAECRRLAPFIAGVAVRDGHWAVANTLP